jgi:hypothetical protein
VTKGHWLFDLEISDATRVKVVQVGSANTARAQPDEYFIWTGFRDISVL